MTTTTTTRTTTPSVVIETPPPDAVVTDQVDCAKTKVTKTDEATGDTMSKTKPAAIDPNDNDQEGKPTMNMRLLGFLSGVSAFALVGVSAMASTPDLAPRIAPAQSFGELLDPIPDALSVLKAEDQRNAEHPVQLAQFYEGGGYGYHHHHHHFDRRVIPFGPFGGYGRFRHHHHHHHNYYYHHHHHHHFYGY